MTDWLSRQFATSSYFMPHGHCYLWIPSLLWLHVASDVLIGTAYIGISIVLWGLVRRLSLPFSPVFVAFGLFIALCGGTHFMSVWTVWTADYWTEGLLKAATAAASVATAIGLLVVKPQIQQVTESARLSEQRRIRLESTHAELETLYTRLKEADEFRTRFFANVSHELRTPLALILGPAQQMRNADNLTPAQHRALQGISDNGTVLLKQVNDLLDLTRLQATKVTLAYTEVDLAPWTRRLVSHFDEIAAQRRLTVTVDTPATLPAQVDPEKLERAFINLVGNAVKFTPQDGSIRVALASAGDRLTLAVADSGPGIDADERVAIFERFHRGEPDTAQIAGGTGLGLAIAKDFVELHGGTLTVVDADLGGSLFTIEVPLHAPEGALVAAAPFVPPASDTALEGIVIELARFSNADENTPVGLGPEAPQALVIEDNPDMSRFISEVLADDFGITTAADGAEGLAKAEVLRPDLIISDVMMPGMDGEALVNAIRSKPDFDATPLLMLTAKADDALRVRLLEQGAQDYVVKPFTPAELRARAVNLAAAKRTGDMLRDSLASASTDLEKLAQEIVIKNRHLASALDAAEVGRDAAERASLVKSSFLGLLSHEIRTPLSAILLNLELLSRDRGNALPEALKKRVDRLGMAARQLQTLMEGLLEYTRFERGGIEPRLQPVDMARLATEVIDEYRLLDSDGPGIILDGDTASMPMLQSDSRLIKVVLSNLIGNALKFGHGKPVTVRLLARPQAGVVEVRDQGAGMPTQALSRIFLPFEQLEPLQRKSLPGVGLGLALVKQIVQSLRGAIEVDSEVGVGSTFRVVLPIDQSSDVPSSQTS